MKGLFDNEPPPEEEEDQLKGVRPDWSKEGYRIWIATRATRNLETVRHRRCFSSNLWGARLAFLLAKLQVAVWSKRGAPKDKPEQPDPVSHRPFKPTEKPEEKPTEKAP